MEGILRRAWPVLRASTVLASIFVAAITGSAAADEVTSKGTVLRGKVTGLSGSGVTFEPEYGKGALEIKWEDVTDIRSEGSFHVLHGEDEATPGQLHGLRDGQLLVGPSPEAATGVDIESIFMGVALADGRPSFPDRMRAYWRYWDGHLDLGYNLQRATTDTTGFLILFETVRTNYPTRLTLGAGYRYATQKNKEKKIRTDASGNPILNPDGSVQTFTDHTTSRIEDLAFGLIRGDYNLTERFYTFASGDATYDSIQQLSIRGVPKAGVGYIIYEEKLDETTRNFLQAEIGGGWVYEKYFDEETDNYFTIVIGALAEYHLPYGAVFGWKLDYLPAVDDFGNFLLRNDAYLSLPIIGPIAAKLGLRDEYDSMPADDVDENSLYFLAGLSLGW